MLIFVINFVKNKIIGKLRNQISFDELYSENINLININFSIESHLIKYTENVLRNQLREEERHVKFRSKRRTH